MMPSPLLLYIHIPFCVHKCPYCDFNSHERAHPRWAKYALALQTELEHWLVQPQFHGRPIQSVFFGGGTPSLAPPDLIAAILDSVRTSPGGMSVAAEITLEANPGTVDSAHFRGYREAGVNRLSIGIQSLQDAELEWLERIHNRDEAVAAFHTARDAGFANINLDLMYGLPGQTLQTWLHTLDEAIGLSPEHLSCYQLTVEAHTKLAARHTAHPYALPDDETALDFFWRTRHVLAGAGFAAYEISNFAKEGFRSQHNDGYWLYHDYIGVGAGASGKWDTEDGGVYRYSNSRSPEVYSGKIEKFSEAVHSSEYLDPGKASAEALWQGLRRVEGVDRTWYRERFGADCWQRFAAALENWRASGHLELTETVLRLSDKGIDIADNMGIAILSSWDNLL